MFKLFVLLLFILPRWGLAVQATPTATVSVTWKYQNFPLKINMYSVRDDKSSFVSETKIVDALKDTPAVKDLKGVIKVPMNGSSSAVLVVENKTNKDAYFFAVPHELNPHHASAGHYFECLCIGRVYKLPPHKTWYRIIRINLNHTFEKLARFEINHQIVGLTEQEVHENYKNKLYTE